MAHKQHTQTIKFLLINIKISLVSKAHLPLAYKRSSREVQGLLEGNRRLEVEPEAQHYY